MTDHIKTLNAQINTKADQITAAESVLSAATSHYDKMIAVLNGLPGPSTHPTRQVHMIQVNGARDQKEAAQREVDRLNSEKAGLIAQRETAMTSLSPEEKANITNESNVNLNNSEAALVAARNALALTNYSTVTEKYLLIGGIIVVVLIVGTWLYIRVKSKS